MPRFKKLDPSEVIVGRGPAKISREPYLKAIQGADAGSIELDDEDRPGTVKRLLREAAKDLGIKIRSSWADDTQRVLVWKKSRTRSRPRAGASRTVRLTRIGGLAAADFVSLPIATDRAPSVLAVALEDRAKLLDRSIEPRCRRLQVERLDRRDDPLGDDDAHVVLVVRRNDVPGRPRT